MRKIVIQGPFGPVADLELDLDKHLDIVIGPQASGKSTLAKLIFFCRKIRDYLVEYLSDPQNFRPDLIFLKTSQIFSARRSNITQKEQNTLTRFRSFNVYLTQKFMRYFGETSETTTGPFEVCYYYSFEEKEKIYVKLSLSKAKHLNISFSPDMIREISTCLDQAAERYSSFPDSFSGYREEQQAARDYFSVRMQKLFLDADELYYMPAGRSILSYLAVNGFFALTDILIQDYVKLMSSLRSRFTGGLSGLLREVERTEGQFEDAPLAAKLLEKILRANYRYNPGSMEDRLYFSDQGYVELCFASSGQQDALWYLHLLFLLILEKRRAFLVLEEPETHLFPVAQKSVMELIALLIHSTDSSVFITTHSPYVLTSANLLIYSGQVENALEKKAAETAPEEKENSRTGKPSGSVVTPALRIDPEKYDAFMISNQGEFFFESIVEDDDARVIDVQRINEVTETLNDKAEKIMEREITGSIRREEPEAPKTEEEQP